MIFLTGPWRTIFSEVIIRIQTFSFTKIHLKTSSAKWRPFSLGLNVLTSTAVCIPLLMLLWFVMHALILVLTKLWKYAHKDGRLIEYAYKDTTDVSLEKNNSFDRRVTNSNLASKASLKFIWLYASKLSASGVISSPEVAIAGLLPWLPLTDAGNKIPHLRLKLFSKSILNKVPLKLYFMTFVYGMNWQTLLPITFGRVFLGR